MAVTLVPIDDIEPLSRNPGVQDLDPDRLLSILRGICTGDTIRAALGRLPPGTGKLHYELVAGFHRFYASAAVGYTHLPMAVRQFFSL